MDTTYKVIDNSYCIFMTEAPPLADIKPLMIGGNSKYIEFTVDSPISISSPQNLTKTNVIDNITDKITGGFNLDANLTDTDSSSLASEQINRILNKQTGGYEETNAANFNTELFSKLMMEGSETSDSMSESLTESVNKSNLEYGSNASRLNKLRRMEDKYDEDEEDESDSEDEDEEYNDDDDEDDEDIDKDDEDDEESYSASSRTGSSSSLSSSKYKKVARNLMKLNRLKKEHYSSSGNKREKDLELLNNLTLRSHLARNKLDQNSESSKSPLAYKGNKNNQDTLTGGSSEDSSASYLESSINTNSINLIKGTRTVN